ncbi:HIT family protein [Cytophagales bacterium LB-30]|uniref:HIT family protein n=1 Tax=Shiella aurantiaca TaxID=3058365 RepID=A0ABT8F3L9_9BACT|nr:HIT family protein [Shiella aurantiaca]MDN4164959.1 HIT family protein [Shiella aurantiaca]
MASIFTKIINREIPGHIVAETDEYIAILDIMPVALGHVLVIPKKEVDYIFDLDDATYQGLQAFAKKVATALKKAMPCKRIGVAVIGLEVPHTHIHLVPMNTMDDISFTKPKLKPSQEKLVEIAEKIKSQL